MMTTKILVKFKFNIDRKGWKVEGAVVLDTRGGGAFVFSRLPLPLLSPTHPKIHRRHWTVSWVHLDSSRCTPFAQQSLSPSTFQPSTRSPVPLDHLNLLF